MSLDFPFTIAVIKFIAVITRVGAFVFAFPMFNSPNFPQNLKIGFIVALSVFVTPFLPPCWADEVFVKDLSLFYLVILIMSEVLLGLSVALIVMLLVEIFSFAGMNIDRDMGLMMANIVDPSSGENRSVTAGVLVQMFMILFLVMNGHHELIRFTVASFSTIPPGKFVITGDLTAAVVELSNFMLVEGFKLAMPLFVIIMFISIGMGLMARVGQDFPVLMLSFPLRIFVGLLMLSTLFQMFMVIGRKIGELLLEWLDFLISIG